MHGKNKNHMPRKYSIITTCKGRLHNLKVTLPRFLEQPDSEVIVVDYDCPDGTSGFVKKTYPAAQVVSVFDQPRFNVSHARNLGSMKATGDFLVFLDADIVIARNFISSIDRQMDKGMFAAFAPSAQNSLRGSCVVERKSFERIGGYDELLGGYEGEDLELYMRLRFIAATMLTLEPALVDEVIEQSTEERARYRGGEDIKMQFLRGQLYMLAKEMLMSVQSTPVLNHALRQKLLAGVNQNLTALYTGEKDFSLEVVLPDKYKRGYLNEWEFSRAITIKAKRKRPG